MRTILARALLLLTLVLVACSPAAPAAPAPPSGTPAGEALADKQSLRAALFQVPGNLTMQSGTFYQFSYWPLFDNLVSFGPGFQPVPSVAEKWELSPNGLDWTFTIRKGILWPDGTPLTAQDVLFSLDKIFEKNWPQRAFYGAVTQRSAPDDYTLKLTTAAPDLAVPNYGISLWIYPKKYYESVGDDGFLEKPVGSGPYELVSQKIGDSYTFKKRSAKHAFRETPLTDITFTLVPDPVPVVTGLKLGEIDYFTGSLDADRADELKRAGLTISAYEVAGFVLVMPQDVYEKKNSPLKDIRVRQALNYAVDKETISKGIFKGFNRAVGQYGTPGTQFWDDSVQPVPYDPKKAKELLAAAGYANGFKISVDLTTSSSQAMALAVQANLRDVGVDLEIVNNTAALYLDKYFNRAPRSDLFIQNPGETNGFFVSMRNAYTCQPPGGASLGMYCNPQFDSLFSQAVQERDPAKRAQIYKQANKVIRDDWTALYLVTLVNYTANQAKVKGTEQATPTVFNLDKVYFTK